MSYIDPNLLWGSNGRNGDKPLTWKPLKDLTTDHLQAILFCCSWHISKQVKDTIRHILKERKKRTYPNITDRESRLVYNGYVTKRNHITGENYPLAPIPA